MRKKLSVVVPVYNLEKNINNTIESIVEQLNPLVDLIMINDGSLDSSLDVLKEYQKKYNFKVFDQSNIGLYKTRVKSLSVIDSEYVWFVDGGDIISHNSIKTILDNLKNNIDILLFDYIKVDEQGTKKTIKQSFENDLLRDIMVGKISPSVWSKVFKVDKLKMLNFTNKEIVLGEDLYISSLYTIEQENNMKFSCVNETLYYYIYDSNSITATHKGEETIIVCLCEIKKALLSNEILKKKYEICFNYLCFNQLIMGRILMAKNPREKNEEYYQAYKDLTFNIDSNNMIKFEKICIFLVELKIRFPYLSNFITTMITKMSSII